MRVGVVAVVLLLVGVPLTACGEDVPSERDEIAATIENLQKDLQADRVEAVCRSLSRRPRRQLGTAGHAVRPTTCPDDLYKLIFNSKSFNGRPVKGLGDTPPPEIASIELNRGGGTATAKLTFGEKPFDVPLVKEGGRWMIGDFFGATGPVSGDMR